MNGVDSPLATKPAPQPAPKSTRPTVRKGTPAQKCPPAAGTRNGERPAPKPIDTAFIEIETKQAEAHTWPHHFVLWFQPERAPAKPAWTGLGIERRNRIPRPDFSPVETAPLDRADGPANPLEALKRVHRFRLPDSDLEPLGWDPRAICRKEDR